MYVNLGEDQRAQAAYPQSNAGDDAAIVPIVGQPPGLEYQVQYSKPREADSITLKTFPRPGSEFESWKDHLRDAITAASAIPKLAYPWILRVEEATFEELADEGPFSQLDHKLATALKLCIPDETNLKTSLLRQKIQQEKDQMRIESKARMTWSSTAPHDL